MIPARPTISPDDADLLQQFAANRSPEAFRQLVDRHIGAVYATARRVLHDPHLAEDVTQSVFILLAQRAGKIQPGPLFGWLYKVTHYACANARRTARRREQREQEAAAMRLTTTPQASVSDAQALLDPALLSLSAHERDILLLRYTADLPLAEIARLSHIPQETAKKRLHRALTKIRRYFASHGMLSAAPAALHALAPAAPALLALAPTITAAALAPASSSASLLIAKGVSHLMFTAKLAKIGLVAAVLLLSTTVATVTVHLLAQTPPGPATPPVLAAAPAIPPQPQEMVQVTGIVEDEQGKPVAGAAVWEDQNILATSDAQGLFTMKFPQGGTLFAYLVASSPDGSLLAYTYAEHLERISSPSGLRLVLRPAKELTVNVADAKGAPVADATVVNEFEFKTILGHATSNAQGVAVVRYPVDIPQLLHAIAAKPSVGLDYIWWENKARAPSPGMLDGNFQGPVSLVLNGTRTVNIHVADDDQQPVAGATIKLDDFSKANKGDNDFTVELNDQFSPSLFSLTTDAQGNATSAIIPPDAIMPLTFTREHKFTFHITKDGYQPRAFMYDPAAGKDGFNISLSRPVHIVTRVSDSTGNAIAGAHIYIYGREAADSIERASSGTSAEDGLFAFDGNPNVYYTFIAQLDQAVSPVAARLIRPGTKPDIIDLTLRPAIRVHGRVIARPNQSRQLTLRMKEESYLKLPPAQQILTGDIGLLTVPIPVRGALADKDGFFEFYALPGSYSLSAVPTDGRSLMPKLEFELTNESDHEVNFDFNQIPKTIP